MALPRKDKAPIVVPSSVRRRAGFKPSDKLEFKASGGVITITAKPESADDEHAPEQRRKILADLKLAQKDIAEGRFYGPYETVDQMIESVEAELRKRAAAKKRKRTG
jgi:bifunctional DNA-binding transcriptional regulator/antitoxin component of YhaV-PrlF toxin-antitoxin module